MLSVTKEELKTYYDLRRLTESLGLTDGVLPRPHISRYHPVAKISRRLYRECVEAEIDILRIEGKAREHQIKSLEREKADLVRMLEEDGNS